MPIRATKRGADRTPLDGSYDAVVCGASFAGLAVARGLAGTGAEVLVVDRYEIGERQTSACAAPTVWLERLGLRESITQTFGELVLHTPKRSFRWRLPYEFSTFDYAALCAQLWEQCGDARFETATVTRRSAAPRGEHLIHTDRGDISSRLVVDALGWRRVLGSGAPIQPPAARLSRGLEVHPRAAGPDLEIWLDPRYVRAGYAWNFPAADELRVGVGSFDPRDHVREPTVSLASDLGLGPDGFQGNWIPHQIRDATQDGVFFAGDSAGHCFPATAEGIRPALFFGCACARELRHVLLGRQTREQALTRYAGVHEDRRWAWQYLLAVQRMIGALNRRSMMTPVLSAMSHGRFVDWAMTRYLGLCPAPPAQPAAEPHPRAAQPAHSSLTLAR